MRPIDSVVQHDFFPVEEILAGIKDAYLNKSKKLMLSAGYKVDYKRVAVLTLMAWRGNHCVKCGLEGTTVVSNHSVDVPCVVVEGHCQKNGLNLYGFTAEGEPVLFTKDHIIPRSEGGLNTLWNYQLMCAPCNNKKASLPEEEKTTLAQLDTYRAMSFRGLSELVRREIVA